MEVGNGTTAFSLSEVFILPTTQPRENSLSLCAEMAGCLITQKAESIWMMMAILLRYKIETIISHSSLLSQRTKRTIK